MARSLLKAKGRRNGHSFLMLTHQMLNHESYTTLSARAVKMLVDIAAQYNGSNNGDLCAARSIMLPKGWTSNDQRQKAINELLEHGLIMVTRLGYRPNVPTLYAITWQSIDHCGGKLETKATTQAPNNWKSFKFSDVQHTG